jgi:hypothetical protein
MSLLSLSLILHLFVSFALFIVRYPLRYTYVLFVFSFRPFLPTHNFFFVLFIFLLLSILVSLLLLLLRTIILCSVALYLRLYTIFYSAFSDTYPLLFRLKFLYLYTFRRLCFLSSPQLPIFFHAWPLCFGTLCHLCSVFASQIPRWPSK